MIFKHGPAVLRVFYSKVLNAFECDIALASVDGSSSYPMSRVGGEVDDAHMYLDCHCECCAPAVAVLM